MEHVPGPLHYGLGPAALGFALGHTVIETLDNAHQSLTGVLLEQLLIKGINMVKTIIPANGRLYSRNAVDKSLRRFPAHNRTHKGLGIHRGEVGPASYKGAEIVVQFAVPRLQGGDFFHSTHSVFSVYYFFSYLIHSKISPILILLSIYYNNLREISNIIFSLLKIFCCILLTLCFKLSLSLLYPANFNVIIVFTYFSQRDI